MSEARHTPGPWRVSERGERTPYTEICVIDAPGGDVEIITDNESSDAMADARLIAAAPEMYEALKMWRERLRGPGEIDLQTLLHLTDAAIEAVEGTEQEQ